MPSADFPEPAKDCSNGFGSKSNVLRAVEVVDDDAEWFGPEGLVLLPLLLLGPGPGDGSFDF